MKIKKLIWPSLLCIFFVANANAAGIPPLPDVDAATAAAHPELASRREALAQERETLRSKSMKQKGACNDVFGTVSKRVGLRGRTVNYE